MLSPKAYQRQLTRNEAHFQGYHQALRPGQASLDLHLNCLSYRGSIRHGRGSQPSTPG